MCRKIDICATQNNGSVKPHFLDVILLSFEIKLNRINANLSTIASNPLSAIILAWLNNPANQTNALQNPLNRRSSA